MVSMSQVHLWFIGEFGDKLVGLVMYPWIACECTNYLLVAVTKCRDQGDL